MQIKLKIGNTNKTTTLINEGEINILKTPGLTEIDFDIVLPNVEYPFARYKEGFKPAEYFLARLEEMKVGKAPFQFIVSRQMPDGEALYGTNMKVSLEEYSIEEDAGEGFDIVVSVQLKQYRDYGTKVCNISLDGGKNKATIGQNRANGENVPSGKTYTVKPGDSLWKIAATQLGSGARWKEIYELNNCYKREYPVYDMRCKRDFLIHRKIEGGERDGSRIINTKWRKGVLSGGGGRH